MGEFTPPYVQAPDDESILFMPVIETEPGVVAILGKIGLKRWIGIDRQGNFAQQDGDQIMYWEISQQTPYTTALYNIALEEKAGHLETGTYQQALSHMLKNTFDDTPLARRYLPRQQD